MDKEGKGQVGTPQKSVFHQQHPAAARSTGHIGEIQGTSDLRKERMLPACHVQPENEQLPQGNRRFLRHKEKSDHARCQAHFRDHRHARQQCTLAGRVRHARTCFHTHDAALCAGHEQQPERGDEQCEGTSGAIDVRHTIKAVPGGWLFLYQDSSGITAILSISYLQI